MGEGVCAGDICQAGAKLLVEAELGETSEDLIL